MRCKKRRPNKIRFAHLLLAFILRRFAEWPMSIKVHWKHVLNFKLKGEVENWSFWIKTVANVFINFLFQYNILPTFELSKMRSRLWAALLNILKSSQIKLKKIRIYNTRIANLRRRAGLWVSTKFNRASLQILYVHVYAIDIERMRH